MLAEKLIELGREILRHPQFRSRIGVMAPSLEVLGMTAGEVAQHVGIVEKIIDDQAGRSAGDGQDLNGGLTWKH